MVPEHLMEVVKKARTIAVVGASPREGRPSLRIYRFLSNESVDQPWTVRVKGSGLWPLKMNWGIFS